MAPAVMGHPHFPALKYLLSLDLKATLRLSSDGSGLGQGPRHRGHFLQIAGLERNDQDVNCAVGLFAHGPHHPFHLQVTQVLCKWAEDMHASSRNK